jgi:hypothetical protein
MMKCDRTLWRLVVAMPMMVLLRMLMLTFGLLL